MKKAIEKIANEIVPVNRLLMQKIENYILQADKETLDHLEKMITQRRDQLK